MSRRAPLSNLPNAVNSPVQGPVAAKRSRSQSAVQREPPSKKQATESTVLRTPRRSHAPTVNDVERKATNNAAKKIVARKRPTQSAVPPPTFADINAQKNQQNVVTAWKKHYKKVFPTFVFYFDSVPADVIGEAKKHLNHLGAVRFSHERVSLVKILTPHRRARNSSPGVSPMLSPGVTFLAKMQPKSQLKGRGK